MKTFRVHNGKRKDSAQKSCFCLIHLFILKRSSLILILYLSHKMYIRKAGKIKSDELGLRKVIMGGEAGK